MAKYQINQNVLLDDNQQVRIVEIVDSTAKPSYKVRKVNGHIEVVPETKVNSLAPGQPLGKSKYLDDALSNEERKKFKNDLQVMFKSILRAQEHLKSPEVTRDMATAEELNNDFLKTIELAKSQIRRLKIPVDLQDMLLQKFDEYETRLTTSGTPPMLDTQIMPFKNIGSPQDFLDYKLTFLIPTTREGYYFTYCPAREAVAKPKAGETEFVILEEHPEWVLFGSGFHWLMTKGRKVAYAGHVCFDNNQFLLWWNNNTGHYVTHPGLAFQAEVARYRNNAPVLPLAKFRPMNWPMVLQSPNRSNDASLWTPVQIEILKSRFDKLAPSMLPPVIVKALAQELNRSEKSVEIKLRELGKIQ